MKPIVISVLLLSVTGAVAAQRAATPRAAASPAANRGAMKAIGSARDIMLAITIPTSSDVFNAAAEPPKDNAGWEKTRHQALALAESANLLLMPERSANRAEWDALAIAQRDAAVVAMKAAEKKDADALSNASDALYETCDNCHKKFMPNR